jgi:hypothetical protein
MKKYLLLIVVCLPFCATAQDDIKIKSKTGKEITVNFKDLSAEIRIDNDSTYKDAMKELKATLRDFRQSHKSITLFDMYVVAPRSTWYKNYSIGKIQKLK